MTCGAEKNTNKTVAGVRDGAVNQTVVRYERDTMSNNKMTRRDAARNGSNLAKLDDKSIELATEKIEDALATCQPDKIRHLPALSQAVRLAQGMQAVRDAMTTEFVETVFMPLMGTPVGFTTDRDHRDDIPKYSVDVVRNVMLEAMMKGLRPIDNEIIIISKRCYAGKNGCQRLVRNFDGLTNLVVEIGVPSLAPDKTGALVPARASWLLNGKPMQITKQLETTTDSDGTKHTFDNRIAVRVNKDMGVDAIKGKASRKLHNEIYERLTGMSVAGDEDDYIDTTGEVVVDAEVLTPQTQVEQVEQPPTEKPKTAGPRKAKVDKPAAKQPAKDDSAAKPTAAGEIKPTAAADKPVREPGADEDETPPFVTYDGEVLDDDDLDNGQLSLG